MGHLRALLFDSTGKQLPPLLRGPKVSTALLPVMKLAGMTAYAGTLVDDDPARRDAVIAALTKAQHARPVKVYGVALVSCSERGYIASFAVLAPSGKTIWCGEACCPRLADVEDHVEAGVRRVRLDMPDAAVHPVAL